jgi:hypothetical protein
MGSVATEFLTRAAPGIEHFEAIAFLLETADVTNRSVGTRFSESQLERFGIVGVIAKVAVGDLDKGTLELIRAPARGRRHIRLEPGSKSIFRGIPIAGEKYIPMFIEDARGGCSHCMEQESG